MPLKLVTGSIDQFQTNSEPQSYQELIFEDDSPNAPVTSIRIVAYLPQPNKRIELTMPLLTEEIFEEKYRKFQAIVNCYSKKGGGVIYCEYNFLNTTQFELLCEFIRNIVSEDFLKTFKSVASPRPDTPEETLFKLGLKTLSAKSFNELLSTARGICKKKDRDALYVLGHACMNIALFQEAYDSFSAIPENNWYRDSSEFYMSNLALENVDLTGLNEETKHETLKEHLITFIQSLLVDQYGMEDMTPLAWKLLAFADLNVADFSDNQEDFKNPYRLLLKLGDLHYSLQKKNPTFKPKVSFHEQLKVELEPPTNNQSNFFSNNLILEQNLEDWALVQGNVNDCMNPTSITSLPTLLFVNKAPTPLFFSKLELSIRPVFYENDLEDNGSYLQDLHNFHLSIYFPGTYEDTPNEAHEAYKSYKTIFRLRPRSDQTLTLYSIPNELTKKHLEELFAFLKNKIPTNILETLKQCIVPTKLNDTRTQFMIDFMKDLSNLDVEGKFFSHLFTLAEKLYSYKNNEKVPTPFEENAFFVLGERCLALGLLDKAYQAFDRIKENEDVYESQAHIEMSKILLNKIEIDPKDTDDINHVKIGEGIAHYLKINDEKNFHIAPLVLNLILEKLSLYAGLGSKRESKQEESFQSKTSSTSDEDILLFFESMLEMCERIYLLKKQNPKTEKTESNNVVTFSSNARQVASNQTRQTEPTITPPLETEEGSRKKRSNWNSMEE